MVRRGATFIELTVTISVLAVIGASLAPVVNAAVDAFASARDAGDAADEASFALDRIVRMLREAPEGATTGTAGVSVAGSDRVALSDGSEIELVGTTLEITEGGQTAILAEDVSVFELSFLGDDGITDTSATPEDTHTIQIRLVVAGLDLRGIAMPRVRMAG
ncbi:MAG: hypothetical protein AAGB51_09250 [Planctomycetota bacterium]